MKFTFALLPVLVAVASPAAAYTRVVVNCSSVVDLDSSFCNNLGSPANKIEPEDFLYCTVYDQKDCTGNSAATSNSYSVGQAPQNLATLASYWCYPTMW